MRSRHGCVPTVDTSCTAVLPSPLQIPGTLEEIFTQLVETYHIPKHQQLPLLFKLRTARYFGDYEMRLKCIEARLQSIAIGSEWRGRGRGRGVRREIVVSWSYIQFL